MSRITVATRTIVTVSGAPVVTVLTIRNPLAGVLKVDGQVARQVVRVTERQVLRVTGEVTRSVVTVAPVARILTVGIQGPPGKGEKGDPGDPGEQGPPGLDAPQPPRSPQFTYSNGQLTRVDYEDGSFKELSYSSGLLMRLDFTRDGVIERKDFVYDSGVLMAINQSVLP